MTHIDVGSQNVTAPGLNLSQRVCHIYWILMTPRYLIFIESLDFHNWNFKLKIILIKYLPSYRYFGIHQERENFSLQSLIRLQTIMIRLIWMKYFSLYLKLFVGYNFKLRLHIFPAFNTNTILPITNYIQSRWLIWT